MHESHFFHFMDALDTGYYNDAEVYIRQYCCVQTLLQCTNSGEWCCGTCGSVTARQPQRCLKCLTQPPASTDKCDTERPELSQVLELSIVL